MKDTEIDLADAYKRADEYARRIMNVIREQHEQDRVNDPAIREFEDADYSEGVEQFREMALHHLKISPKFEVSAGGLTADEFVDRLLEHGGLPDMATIDLNRTHAPK